MGVSGGGRVAQIYAIRQAIAKALVAYYQKFVDEHSKSVLKTQLVEYDRSLEVPAPGPGTRSLTGRRRLLWTLSEMGEFSSRFDQNLPPYQLLFIFARTRA